MTDPTLSVWGAARNKINKLVLECADYDEAQIVADNAKARGDMKDIEIIDSYERPQYGKGYFTSYHYKSSYPSWYKKGFLKN